MGTTAVRAVPAAQNGRRKPVRRIYVAGPWRKKALIATYEDDLRRAGFEVTSQWTEEPDGPHYGLGLVSDRDALTAALRDVEGVAAADLVVCVSNDGQVDPGGGRHFECGLAYGQAKRLAFVGWPETIFQTLPEFARFDLWRECLAWIRDGAPGMEDDDGLADAR